MKCAVVTTTSPDLASSIEGVMERFLGQLGGSPDLLVAFFTPHHSADAELLRERLVAGLEPGVLLGCPARGVIGEQSEFEVGAGLSLWGARWPGARLDPFILSCGDGQVPSLEGYPEDLPADASFLLLADPFTTPPEDLLGALRQRYPGRPVVGGMASGAAGPGDANLMTNDAVLDEGTVGVAISGRVRLDPLVSQGCRPVGKHFVITQAERNAIFQLGGQPALAALQATAQEADARDADLMATALHVGRVVDERKSQFESGDLLVRNVLGIDPERQMIAISDYVRAGQTVQFMVRDAETASAEYSELLSAASHGGKTLGALLFSCNGRGSRLFGRPHHDVHGLHEHLGDVPTAGFFAAGEIGPVGGQPFLHGFTASLALFRENGA